MCNHCNLSCGLHCLPVISLSLSLSFSTLMSVEAPVTSCSPIAFHVTRLPSLICRIYIYIYINHYRSPLQTLHNCIPSMHFLLSFSHHVKVSMRFLCCYSSFSSQFNPNTLPHQRNKTQELRREEAVDQYDTDPIRRTAIHEVGKVCWEPQALYV